MRVPEPQFRASQLCRVLGSPVSFGLAAVLLDRGPLSLTQLVRVARRSKSVTCYHLSKLRLAQIVRYENRDGETLYWIKYPGQLRPLLAALDVFVDFAARARHRGD